MARINDLISTINKLGGLASSSRFAVQITPPASLGLDSRDLLYLCDTVNLPGVQFGTELIRHKGYGLEEKRVNHVTFDDITCTFFIDNSGKVLEFFNKWMLLTIPFDPDHSGDTMNGHSSESYAYPTTYWGTMDIAVKSQSDNDIIKYTMDKCHPINIGQVQLGWEQNDSIARVAVTFAFRSYTTSKVANIATKPDVKLDRGSDYRNMSLVSVLNSSVEDAVARNTQTI